MALMIKLGSNAARVRASMQHNRNTGEDFVRMIREFRPSFGQGVVHSFTGPAEEAAALIAEGECLLGWDGVA
jgi:Tat protein secretion system quality control protein TatD with DNase activity